MTPSGELDVRRCWEAAGRPPLAGSPLVQLDSLPPTGGAHGELDGWLLRHHPAHASLLARLLCGVAEPTARVARPCPRSDRAVAAELHAWQAAAAPARRSHVLSAIAVRIGARCADLVCSESTCRELALRRCVARLAAEGAHAAPGGTADRPTCEAWLEAVSREAKPLCDGLTGRCLPPPEVSPGTVLWPSRSCVPASPARPTATKAVLLRLCRPPHKSGACGQCIVRRAQQQRTLRARG